MEFEFVLPQRNEDLLETTGNLYCVRKIFKEQECQEELRSEFFRTFVTSNVSLIT